MNMSLYNKIMARVSKVVKKSINEAYDNRYLSFDDLSILNHSGNIGDILLVNLYGDLYRIKPGNLDINESMFDDIDFDDDYGASVSDKLIKWKDISICFGEGLWVYLDWVGFNKPLKWAPYPTKLYNDEIPDTNGYENTQYILNNYKNCIQDTIWEEILNCEYPIYIPDKNLLKIISNVNKKYKLLDILFDDLYWSSSLCVDPNLVSSGGEAFGVYSRLGDVDNYNKTYWYLSIALLHF